MSTHQHDANVGGGIRAGVRRYKMITTLLMALALQASSPVQPLRSVSEQDLATLEAVNRAANAGRTVTLSGERFADLENAALRHAAEEARQEALLLDAAATCTQVESAAYRLNEAASLIEAWAADSTAQTAHAKASDLEDALDRAAEVSASTQQAKKAMRAALALFCPLTRP